MISMVLGPKYIKLPKTKEEVKEAGEKFMKNMDILQLMELDSQNSLMKIQPITSTEKTDILFNIQAIVLPTL